VTWLYQRVTIPNYEALAAELKSTFDVLTRSYTSVQRTQLYITLYAHEMLPLSPLLYSFLKSIGLLNRFMKSINSTPNITVSNILHIDSPNNSIKYSFNLPLSDCNGTYTAFYAADSPLVLSPSGRNLIAPPGMVEHEIDRVECSTPMFINANTPHMGVSTRPGRLLMCIRFTPELTRLEVQHICSILKFAE
jgi:hypothetical protein